MIGAFHSDQWGGFKTYGVFPVPALTVRKDHGPRHRAGDVGRPDRCGILVTVVRLRAADATCVPAGPSASLAETRNRVCNSMRQAGLEPTTFGSGGGTGQRPPTLAVVVSGTYASRASASASQRRPRCYHSCYRESLLRRCLGAATPFTCIRWLSPSGTRLKHPTYSDTAIEPPRAAIPP